MSVKKQITIALKIHNNYQKYCQTKWNITTTQEWVSETMAQNGKQQQDKRTINFIYICYRLISFKQFVQLFSRIYVLCY